MKKTLTLIIALALGISLNAQVHKHEYSLYLKGGLATLSYSPTKDGSRSGGFGFSGGGLGYTYNLSSHIGLTTGIDVSMYKADVTYSKLNGKYSTTDGSGESFTFSYATNSYKEEQTATYLNIPVMAQYLGGADASKLRFFAAAGFKFGFPVGSKYTATPGTITTTGFYEFENQTYTNLPQYGFYNGVAGSETSGDAELGFSSMLSFEAGAKFFLTNKLGLYAGVYFDCGLNGVASESNLSPIAYQESNPSVLGSNSILNSNAVDKVTPMAVGLKVRIALGK